MAKIKEESGNVYGRLTVIKLTSHKKHNKRLWLCSCECGELCEYAGGQLRNGTTTTCGKCKTKGRSPTLKSKIISDVGRRFGSLIVLSETGRNDYGAIMYKCDCDCGNTTVVQKQALLSHQTCSCGCKRNIGFIRSFNFKTKAKIDVDELEFRVNTIHGNNKYIIDRDSYVNTTTKINIFCSTCEYDFEITPASLMQGHGCYYCSKLEMGKKLRKPFSEFLKEANVKYNNRFEYDESSYSKCSSPVTIYCPEHGAFSIIAANHLTKISNGGCPRCAQFGFDTTKPAILYYLKINHDICDLFKIGITNNTLRSRYLSRDRKIIQPLAVKRYDIGKDAYDAEQSILHNPDFIESRLDSNEIVLASGNTEIFIGNILNIPTPSNEEQFKMWYMQGK